MKAEDLREKLKDHPRTSRGLVRVVAGDVVELAKTVHEPSRAVQAVLMGASNIIADGVRAHGDEQRAAAVEVYQQACDLYELIDAIEG